MELTLDTDQFVNWTWQRMMIKTIRILYRYDYYYLSDNIDIEYTIINCN